VGRSDQGLPLSATAVALNSSTDGRESHVDRLALSVPAASIGVAHATAAGRGGDEVSAQPSWCRSS